MFQRQNDKELLNFLETRLRLLVIFILLISALGFHVQEVQALDYAWVSYNDAAWYDAQPETNITKYNISDGSTSGLLKKFDDGIDTSITVTFTKNGDFVLTSQGAEADSGTDAFTTFNGNVSTAGVIMGTTAGWWVDVEFTGLDPEKTYTFATTAVHDSSTEQNSIYTISGMQSATNASSTGVNILSNESVWFNTGTNKTEGYVARWIGIQPSSEGNFKVRAEGQGSSIIGYAQCVFMLAEELPPPPTVTVTADAGQSKIYGSFDPVFSYTSSDESVVFSGSLERVEGENVGDYAITLGTLSAAGYTIDFVPADFTIIMKSASVTATTDTKVYGDSDPTFAGILEGFLPTDNVTAMYTREAGETVTGSPYAISAILSPTEVLANYDITYTSADFNITKKSASATASANSKTYGDLDPSLTGTLAGFLPADSVTATYARESGESVAGSPYAISATLNPTGVLDNYEITYISADFTISKKSASATASANGKTYGDSDPTLMGSLTGFLPADNVTATYERVAGETVAGSPYAISASLSPTGILDNYDITYTSADFTISTRPIAVKADDKEKFVGSSEPDLTYQLTSGTLVFEDEFSGALIRDPGETVGIYAILQGTLDLNANYNLSFTQGIFTISDLPVVTVTVDSGQNKIYGSGDPSFTYTASDESVEFSGELDRVEGEIVGEYGITQGTLAAAGYTIDFVPANFTITKKSASVTAAENGKVYGDSDPTLTGTLVGFLPADSVSATYEREIGETVAGSPYAISATLSPIDVMGNYDITYTSADFTITTRPVTVTADNKGKALNSLEPDPALTYQITSGSLVFDDEFSGELIREDGEVAGTYAILRNTLALSDNYDLTFVSGSFLIFELSTASITNTYGHMVTLQATFSPAIDNKLIIFSFNGAEACSGTTNVVGYTRCDAPLLADIGTFSDGVSAIFAGDDDFTSINATARLIVLLRPLVVAATGVDKVYDGTTEAEVTLSDDRVTGDDLIVIYTSAVFTDDANVGVDKPISVSGISVSGADIGKYTLQNTTAATSADITMKEITVTADSGQYKFLDDTDPVLTFSYSPSFPPVVFEGELSREAGEALGEYDILQNTLSAGDNYSLTFISAKFNILTAFRIFVPLITK